MLRKSFSEDSDIGIANCERKARSRGRKQIYRCLFRKKTSFMSLWHVIQTPTNVVYVNIPRTPVRFDRNQERLTPQIIHTTKFDTAQPAQGGKAKEEKNSTHCVRNHLRRAWVVSHDSLSPLTARVRVLFAETGREGGSDAADASDARRLNDDAATPHNQEEPAPDTKMTSQRHYRLLPVKIMISSTQNILSFYGLVWTPFHYLLMML